MSCSHPRISVHRATLVKHGGENWLRAVCPDCLMVCDTLAKVSRNGDVHATQWVPSQHTIIEYEYDPKEDARHV